MSDDAGLLLQQTRQRAELGWRSLRRWLSFGGIAFGVLIGLGTALHNPWDEALTTGLICGVWGPLVALVPAALAWRDRVILRQLVRTGVRRNARITEIFRQRTTGHPEAVRVEWQAEGESRSAKVSVLDARTIPETEVEIIENERDVALVLADQGLFLAG